MVRLNLELLVEEPSMEAFLHEFLPRCLPKDVGFRVHRHDGKRDLLAKLPSRPRAYARWIGEETRILVLVDRDADNCLDLKNQVEQMCVQAGLVSLSTARREGRDQWHIATRIVIEELEAWYFGDWQAVRAAYPDASAAVQSKSTCVSPDQIASGTWETFERVMQRSGYFKGGLPKMEVAAAVGKHVDAQRSTSPSFRAFVDALQLASG